MPSNLNRWTFAGLLIAFMTSSTAVGDEPDKTDDPDRDLTAAAAKELVWHKSIAPAIEEARRRKTSILVRVGADWCAWCLRLQKEIVRPEVQRELAGWTLVELDTDNDEDEVSRLSVGPIPALRILNQNGRTVRSHDGYLPAAKLVSWLRGENDEPGGDNNQPVGEDDDSTLDLRQDMTAIPELDSETLVQLVRLLAHRDARIREAVSRRLKSNKGLAAAEVTKAFVRGKLAARLAALDLLIDWKAPVAGLDPWVPQSISADRLNDLEEWAANLSSDAEEAAEQIEPLTAEQLAEARADIDKISAADPIEMEAIGARLARYADRLLPVVQEARQRADSDQGRERLDWLRYRLVASDALMLKWPGGLMRLAAIEAKMRHSAAGELPTVVSRGDEPLLIELFGHPDPFVRELSLKALHEIGGQRSSNELAKLLADPEPNVRAAVLKQLAEKPSAKLVPQIADYVTHEKDPDLIVHAVRLLREIKTEESIKCLMELFSHASWQVRSEAVEAVGAIVGEGNRYGNQTFNASLAAEAWTAVLELLNDSDGFVVGQAVNALKHSDLPIAASPLSNAAERQPELADVVAEALISGSKISTKGTPLLRKWLTNPHENLRAAALMRLQSLDGPKELIPALSDASEKVRIAAAAQVLELCDAKRPNLQPEASDDETGAAAEPAPQEPTSAIGQAARALGSLFQGGDAAVSPAKKSKAKSDVSPKSDSKEDPFPYESWLEKFHAGKGRPSWMKDAIAPLTLMFQSQSSRERIASGVVLIALGEDDQIRQTLLELARQQQELVVQVAQCLRWLPWQLRLQTFNALREIAQGPEQRSQLCNQFVVVRDLRATDVLWDVLADPRMDATLASSVFENWVQIHGIEMHYGYINSNRSMKPIGFRADSVKEIALTSKSEWQRRIALALLLQFDEAVASDAAKAMVDDEAMPANLRTDAFVTILRSEAENDARVKAVEAIKQRNPLFIRCAFVFLNHGGEKLNTFDEGKFHLPHTSSMIENPDKKDELPEGLKVEDFEQFLTAPDDELAAHAAYLAAMLGHYEHLERLIGYWRKMGVEDYDSRSWQKLTYEAIAASDNPRLVPVLEEIYKSMREHDNYHLRELYWTIRSMHGPEILKLRKLMRDEVGMDQLR